MEKTWNEFWTTGKVTDYLAYRDHAESRYREQKELTEHGTVDHRDGDGFDSHAH